MFSAAGNFIKDLLSFPKTTGFFSLNFNLLPGGFRAELVLFDLLLPLQSPVKFLPIGQGPEKQMLQHFFHLRLLQIIASEGCCRLFQRIPHRHIGYIGAAWDPCLIAAVRTRPFDSGDNSMAHRMISGVLILRPAAHDVSEPYKILRPFSDLEIRETVIAAKDIFTLRIISAEMRFPRTHCRKM